MKTRHFHGTEPGALRNQLFQKPLSHLVQSQIASQPFHFVIVTPGVTREFILERNVVSITPESLASFLGDTLHITSKHILQAFGYNIYIFFQHCFSCSAFVKKKYMY